MSKKFRGIRPEDMTKLQQIIDMMSRGSVSYARRIADSIEEPIARNVAEILLDRALRASPEDRDFANRLTEETMALAHKLELVVA
jgi:hypothetical protein